MAFATYNGVSMPVHDGRATILCEGQDICSLYGLDAASGGCATAGSMR